MNWLQHWASELDLRVPPTVKRPGHLLLRLLKNWVLPVPVTILSGEARGSGRQVTAVTAGAQPWVEYLTDLFFDGSPQQRPMGRVPQCVLPRVLDGLAPSVDLVVARTDTLSARLLFSRGYLLVPEWVDLWVNVPDDLAALQRGPHKRDVRNDLRRIRKSGLTYKVSHAEADFMVFYQDYYLPLIRVRHEKYGRVSSLSTLHARFRRGGLIWVLHEGRRVAAALFDRWEGTLHGFALGVLDGDDRFVKLGGLVAAYYSEFRHAHALACSELNLGACRPVLTDGMFRYKRKWGARVVERSGSYYDYLVRWRQSSESVHAFLAHSPLIFRHRGGLSAVTAAVCDGQTTEEDARRVHRRLWTPGLHRLYLLSPSGWEAACQAPPQSILVDLTAGHDPFTPALFTSGGRPGPASAC